MVQGVAGSGKTSVALHRIAYLMYQEGVSNLSHDNIVIISPNPLFGKYISNVLPELGEENVAALGFEDIYYNNQYLFHRQSLKNKFLQRSKYISTYAGLTQIENMILGKIREEKNSRIKKSGKIHI